MQSSVPKQYMPVAGRPLLLWTVDVFDAMQYCERIVIASDDPERLKALIDEQMYDAVIDIVNGGALRQDSVLNAIDAVEGSETMVLVHDAARPCVTPDCVQRVADAAAIYGAALLAARATDTIKTGVDDIVCATLDRTAVWQAQTPQAASAGAFRAAFAHARAGELVLTDDVSALENAGFSVHLVEGPSTNIKVTTPVDIALCETILRYQGRVL
jgi:2-C-methyl-D-erythritol 4-phosphate cytidylyltransferase